MDKRPNNVNTFIQKHGWEIITTVWLVREPVNAFVLKTLNLLTSHKIERIQIKGDENYDTMYHLYVVFELNDGKHTHIHKMEKNDVVKVYEKEFKLKYLNETNVKYKFVSELTDYVTEHDGSKLGLKSFEQVMNELEKAEACLYFYSAKYYNCQHFVLLFLQHLLPDGVHFDKESAEKYVNFILQNRFLQIFEQKGLESFLQSLTNIAATMNRKIIGSGHEAYDDEYADNSDWRDMFDDNDEEYDNYEDEDYYYRKHDHQDQFVSYIKPDYLGNQNTTGSNTNLFILIIMFIFAFFLICICGCFIGILTGYYFVQKIVNKIYL